MGILAAAAFTIPFNNIILKGYTPVQLVFCRDMIITINHNAGYELICHKNQIQIDYVNNCEIIKILGYNYKFGDKVMIINKSTHKLKTLYKKPYTMIQTCKNVTVTL